MSGGNGSDPLERPLKIHGAGSSASQAPKRFYKVATAEEAVTPDGRSTGSFRIHLDGRPVRTPAKRVVELPALELAEAVAQEWAAQRERIDPAAMPLTRLVNSALDGVAGREAEVAADIVKYAGNDLVCYRADQPDQLIARQAAAWDPVLEWAGECLGGRFLTATGIMHVEQDNRLLQGLGRRMGEFQALQLAAMHVMTTIAGSALLAWAVSERRLSAEQAWTAAHVDEDWQIEKWGEDAEAAARRQHRWRDFAAAARIVSLFDP